MRADTNVQKLLDTLEKESESARVNRVATTPATAYLTAPVVAAAAAPTPNREVYDGNNRGVLPGTVARAEGNPPTKDTAVNEAYDGAGDTYDLYLQEYQRDSLDGNGMTLIQTINGVALRSLKAPGTAYNDPVLGTDPQPFHMNDYVHTFADNGGVHINSGIPNHAFYLLSQYLGGNAWEKAGKIWYETLQNISNPHARFVDWADETITSANSLYGTGSIEALLTRRSWRLVGVL